MEAQAGLVPAATGYLYDQAGRVTASIAYHLGDETWRTTTSYGGNFTTTIPPAGATPTTTVVDAHGHTTDLIRYHAGVPADYLSDPTSDYDDTHYTYYPNGKQATLTDPAGNTWSRQYNLLGQTTDTYDPDTGHSVFTYDKVGQLKTVTDGRSKQTTTTYDNDGRKTGLYDTTTFSTLSTSNKLAGWTYDTIATGLPTSTVSYSGGDVITSTVTGYNTFGKVKGQKITATGENTTLIPSGGYTVRYGYTVTGVPNGEDDPSAGDLPAESVTYNFDDFQEPILLNGSNSSGLSWDYVSAAGYTKLGQPYNYTLPTATGTAMVTMSYDDQTHALTNILTTASSVSGAIDNLTYNYSSPAVSKGAGLVTSIVDQQNANTTTDTQCFTYDYATHLSQAWTATDNCTATPSPGNSSTVGGQVAPYWQSWTYNVAGARYTQTDHDTTGNTANDTTTTYNYPTQASGTDQPHTLTNTTATGPAATQQAASYGYDQAGNTTTITGSPVGDQTLSWTTQGNLATTTTATGTTSYVYDPDGNLFIRRDPSTLTLYLGDQQIVLNTTTNTLTGTRYYTFNGATIAARSGNNNPVYLIPDRQGTDTLTIDSVTQAVTRRQYTPFGQPRGTNTGAFPGDKGYVGGSADAATGLVNLGAREYDPYTGRFLSVDSILQASDPNQVNGYDYAGNDPVTGSDPTGTTTCQRIDGPDGPCTSQLNTEDGKEKADEYSLEVASEDQPTSWLDAVAPLRHVKMNHRELMTYLRRHGYTGSDHFTVRDALNFAAINQDNWTFVCMQAFGGSASKCFTDPFLPKRPLWKDALIMAGAVCMAVCGMAVDALAGDILSEERLAATAAGDGGPALLPDEQLSASGAKLASCGSFSADTQVLIAGDKAKPIGTVKAGDTVVATDPTTGKTTEQPVTAVHINHDTNLADLTTIDNAGRHSTIHTTQNHPFWDITRTTWVPAGQLQPGDVLRTTTGGTVTVAAVHNFAGAQPMYNLTVSDTHTYYVIAGTVPILVHNEAGVCPTPGNIAVIGRLPDTDVAKSWPGYDVLDDPDWTLDSNKEWTRQVIQNRQTVYLGSDFGPKNSGNVYDYEKMRQRPFGVELEMLHDAGYTQQGNYLIPPTD